MKDNISAHNSIVIIKSYWDYAGTLGKFIVRITPVVALGVLSMYHLMNIIWGEETK